MNGWKFLSLPLTLGCPSGGEASCQRPSSSGKTSISTPVSMLMKAEEVSNNPLVIVAVCDHKYYILPSYRNLLIDQDRPL